MDNVLDGQYAWAFRLAALLFLGIALVVYFRSRGICTLDQVKRQRNRIFNSALITLLFAIGGYLGFNYFVLSYLGARLGMPWHPLRGAAMLSGVFVIAGSVLYILFLRRSKSRHSTS